MPPKGPNAAQEHQEKYRHKLHGQRDNNSVAGRYGNQKAHRRTGPHFPLHQRKSSGQQDEKHHHVEIPDLLIIEEG